MVKPKLLITVGDIAGIGPEVTVKALSLPEVYKVCSPVLIGDVRVLERVGLNPGRFPLSIIDITAGKIEKVKQGNCSAITGKAAYDCIVKAVGLVLAGEAEGIVTAPISKFAFNLAGMHYSGHTELLSELCGTKNIAMLMVADKLRTVMVTRHIPLKSVSRMITVAEIVRTAKLAVSSLKNEFGLKNPRVGVCALNPHAGEGGLLGNEEEIVIIPAIKLLKSKKMNVSGPLPIDSAWLKLKKGELDLLVTMYHDQAMVGLKCLIPEKIVNVTAGLPFVRTSPGHGTGFDIAGRNLADPEPMIEAIRLCAKLCRLRSKSR